jgi:predicted transcriptional regulator
MATNTAKRETTIVSAQFPRDLADRLTEHARARDRSTSSVIRMAVAAHLERTTDTKETTR